VKINEKARQEKWNELYEILHEILENHIVTTAENDYFLIDDDWGGWHQKICVLNEKYWSTLIQNEIQKVLENKYINWGIVIVFEKHINKPPFTIYYDAIEVNMRRSD
jgi:hypothetical protein